jgi:DnaK suppressor protein
MANSKKNSGNHAKAAKAPARAKAVAGAARKASAKPAAKAKPVAAKKPVKPVAAKSASKGGATKPASKTVISKTAKNPPSKKAAPAKSVKKVSKPAPAKPVVVKHAPAAKAAPAKPVAQVKPVVASAAKAKPSTKNAAEPVGKFVTTSKPETVAASKSSKARTPPPSDNGVTMQDGRYVLPATVHIDLPNNYKPDPKDEYMSPRHLQYFRNKLSKWREELVEESRQTIESLRDEVRDVGDEAERATRETENSLELRTRDRYRKLIAKIDKALKRIEEGRYGFCEETDEEIGIDRLEARPIATLSLDAQERWEHRQKQMGD